MAVKELKSIDISSFTIISTGIAALISIVISIVIVVAFAFLVPNSLATMILVIPTIVFGTIISSIFLNFSISYLYNIIAKKFGFIKFDIEGDYIKKISTKETALIVACITLIMILVVYFAFCLIVPLFLSSLITILMYASQASIAMLAYQGMFLISNTMYIAVGILGTVIIISVFTLLSTYVYNVLADSERGIVVKLTKEDKLTQLESLKPVNFGIAIGAISLILNIVVGLIMIVSGSPMFITLASVLSSFVIAFIEAMIIAAAYNFFAPKLGKLKVELE